uniref:Uncharacterized protein n=1 Tax=Anopheles gambiae TaxID=7165 RepID=A0A3F2YYU7_ANOGA
MLKKLYAKVLLGGLCLIFTIFKQDCLSALDPIPMIDGPFAVHLFRELHRQVCPADKYHNLMVFQLSNDASGDQILSHIMGDLTYTKTVRTYVPYFDTYKNYFHSCNFIAIDSSIHFELALSLENSVQIILFYPKWLHETMLKKANASIVQTIGRGYKIVYDLNNTMEIFHTNKYSNQTTVIDPHNIAIPDELRDLHGHKLIMYILEFVSKVLTFEKYFLEQVANKRNATAIQTDETSGNVNVMPFVSTQSMTATFIIPAFGTVFEAVQVPRAKPKPIVSILTDPFDLYVWITYLVLVLTMAISISLFGKLLGRRRFMEIVLELIMMCLAGPSRAYGGTFENRIITLFCLMGIVLVSSYQSLVISFMSFVRYGSEINTLQEIQDRCLFPDNHFSKFYNFSTFPNGSHPGLGLGCIILTGRDNELQTFLMMANLVNDRHAYAREDYIHHHIQNFRLAKTTFFQYPFCIGVKSHLRELFEFYIQAVVESGIYEYYYNNKTKTDWKYEQRKFIDEVVKIDDLLLLWFAYIGGMFISIISFMVEIVVHREHKLFQSTENKSN